MMLPACHGHRLHCSRDYAALRPARVPIRTPGGRGDRTRGRRAVGIGQREARYGNPTTPTSGIPKASPGATAPPACRLRVAVPVKWPRAPIARPAPIPIRALPVAATGDGQRNWRPAVRAERDYVVSGCVEIHDHPLLDGLK